jgi:histidinol-phosphate aminotransferase
MANENNTNTIARQDIVALTPYQSARREAQGGNTFLNANEAPGSGSYQVSGSSINRYPDFQPQRLISAYANYAGIENSQVLASRGADEGIDVLIRTFCKAGEDNILICPPTYGMYKISAQTQGAGVLTVPLIGDDYQLDINALKALVGQTKLVFLCSPNNPTGNLLNKDDIRAVLELFAGTAIVVVDEAYIEFCPEQTVASWINQYPHLAVLRTLSKAFGLAGLRCGFTLAQENIIELMSKVIAPYPIAQPVCDIAVQALNDQGLTAMRATVTESNQLKGELSQWLENQNWCDEVFASDANFTLFRTNLSSVLMSQLQEQGILIRNQSSQPRLNNCLRISIGSEHELKTLKDKLSEITTQLTGQQQTSIKSEQNPEVKSPV